MAVQVCQGVMAVVKLVNLWTFQLGGMLVEVRCEVNVCKLMPKAIIYGL